MTPNNPMTEGEALAVEAEQEIIAAALREQPEARGVVDDAWPTVARHVGSGDWQARTALCTHTLSEAQAGVWNACLAACKRAAQQPVQEGGGEATDDPLTRADVAGVLTEIAEGFDGGEYTVGEETRLVLIDFASGLLDHPLFDVVGHYFAQNPVAGSTAPPSATVGAVQKVLADMKATAFNSRGQYVGDVLNGWAAAIERALAQQPAQATPGDGHD